MSRKSPVKKSRGSAFNSLRKILLFTLAGRLNLLRCHHCGELIGTVAEFSIEHKIPWEGAEDEEALFFDLNNIAFSHMRCNCAAARKPNMVYESVGAQKRASFQRFYKRHGERWNKARNERRRKK